MPEAAPRSRTARFGVVAVAYRLRVLLMCLLVLAIMSALVPKEFPTAANMASLLRRTSTDALAAAGFALVLLTGQLDLSIGATMTMGGTVVMVLQPDLGWPVAVAAALAAGGLIGLVNGLLVVKARVNSFIVTLGMMTILQGLTRSILKGGAVGAASGDSLATPLASIGLFSPRILLIFVPIILLEVFLRSTARGRGMYLIGANRQTAWYAGLPADRSVAAAFILCGIFSALGGAITAMAANTVMPNLGEKSLMLIVAAVIVGGTSMAGGRGSPAVCILALFALNALTNGLSFLGASTPMKLIANGAVLAMVIVYDACRTATQNLVRGQRRELLAEFDRAAEQAESDDEEDPEGSLSMQTKDRALPIVCVTALACVAMVAILAMVMNRDPAQVMVPYAGGPGGSLALPGTPGAEAANVMALKATDNQPLIHMDTAPLNAPARPEKPEALPDDDRLRWYDQEYSGWDGKKLPQPPSPGGGPRGKRVVSLQYMNHPYWTGYRNGMRRMADAYGMNLKMMEAGNDVKVQADQVAQAIALKPDIIILTPVDAINAETILKQIYDAKIPVIASNLIPVHEGMKYALTWTGPDDWGQFRMLAAEFARKMDKTGKYCIIRHIAGTSCYNSRTWSVVSELKMIAPNMTYLAMESTDLDTEKTKTQVAAWLKMYGSDLKGIVSADDSKAQIGIVQALDEAGRSDVICVSAGSSQTGLNYIKAGKLHAITYQSAEGDGALPIKIAADWFSGKPITRPVYYLQKKIITKKNVEQFLPAQW